MKQIINLISAIAFTSISSGFMAVSAAQALEEGLYWGGGSRYIQIAKKLVQQVVPTAIAIAIRASPLMER